MGHHEMHPDLSHHRGISRASHHPGTLRGTSTADEEAPEENLSMREMLLSHLHNKIVHFPLALGLAGALFIFLGSRKRELHIAAELLIGLAAISAVAAYFTGQAQMKPFKGTGMEPFLYLHRDLGIASALGLWLGVFLGRVPGVHPWLWTWAIAISILLAATGFLGGILAHG